MKDVHTIPIPLCQAGEITHTAKCHLSGEFDVPTIHGPWANLCEEHLYEHTTEGGRNMGFHLKQEQA